MLSKANVAVSSDIRTKHSTQSKHHVEFLNIGPWWYVKKPLGFKRLILHCHEKMNVLVPNWACWRIRVPSVVYTLHKSEVQVYCATFVLSYSLTFPVSWYRGLFPRDHKGWGVNLTPRSPSTADIKNDRSYTLTPSSVLRGVHMTTLDFAVILSALRVK